MDLVGQKLFTDFDPESIPDWKTAAIHTFPTFSNIVVEMLRARETTSGGIILPDLVLETHYDDKDAPIAGIEPSVGCVIGLGPTVAGLEFGNLVLVIDGDGLCVEGFKAGPYEAQNEVRIFGKTVPDRREDEAYIEDLPWEESIIAVMEGNQWAPTGLNIRIRKNPFQKAEGLIQLLSHMEERDCEAVVEAVGDGVTECVFDPITHELRTILPGDRIKYDPRCQWGMIDVTSDIAFIRESAVLAVVA